MPKKIAAEEMTEADLTAEIARLEKRIGALKALRQLRIATSQHRERARRLLLRFQSETQAALEAVRETNDQGEGRAAA